jgi:hypothetical protein
MPYCGVARHLRSPIVLSEKTIDATSTVRRTQIPCYIIVNGNTIPDEWCADYYRHEGVNVKTGVDCAKTCEMMIMGDIVTQIYIPEDIQQQVKSIYSGVRSMAAISVPDFYRIVYQKHIAVKFTVMRNHEIASQMREQIMENFR